jgi:hypothetical protein
VADEKIPTLYKSSNVFVSMQAADYNITVMEALAQKLNVVVPKILCFDPEILQTGLVHRTLPSADNLAAAMRKAEISSGALHPETRHKEIFSRYCWDEAFDDFVRVVAD